MSVFENLIVLLLYSHVFRSREKKTKGKQDKEMPVQEAEETDPFDDWRKEKDPIDTMKDAAGSGEKDDEWDDGETAAHRLLDDDDVYSY